MKKINFKNGTLVSKAKVIIDNTIHEVEPEEYEGETPLSAEILNQIQDNIEEAINGKELYKNSDGNSSEITLSDNVENYNLIKIFYKLHSSAGVQYDLYGSTEISATDKYFSIGFIRPTESDILQICGKRYAIEGNLISPTNEPEYSIGISTNIISQFDKNPNVLRICKVIGY